MRTAVRHGSVDLETRFPHTVVLARIFDEAWSPYSFEQDVRKKKTQVGAKDLGKDSEKGLETTATERAWDHQVSANILDMLRKPQHTKSSNEP